MEEDGTKMEEDDNVEFDPSKLFSAVGFGPAGMALAPFLYIPEMIAYFKKTGKTDYDDYIDLLERYQKKEKLSEAELNVLQRMRQTYLKKQKEEFDSNRDYYDWLNDNNDFDELVKKYDNGTITEAERQILEELDNYNRSMVVTDPKTGELITQGELDERDKLSEDETKTLQGYIKSWEKGKGDKAIEEALKDGNLKDIFQTYGLDMKLLPEMEKYYQKLDEKNKRLQLNKERAELGKQSLEQSIKQLEEKKLDNTFDAKDEILQNQMIEAKNEVDQELTSLENKIKNVSNDDDQLKEAKELLDLNQKQDEIDKEEFDSLTEEEKRENLQEYINYWDKLYGDDKAYLEALKPTDELEEKLKLKGFNVNPEYIKMMKDYYRKIANNIEIQKSANLRYDPTTDTLVDKQVLLDREQEEKKAAEKDPNLYFNPGNYDYVRNEVQAEPVSKETILDQVLGVTTDEKKKDEQQQPDEEEDSSTDDLIKLLTALMGLNKNNNNNGYDNDPEPKDEYDYYEYQLDSMDCTESYNQSYTSKNFPNFRLKQSIDQIAFMKILEVSIPNFNFISEGSISDFISGDFFEIFYVAETPGGSNDFILQIKNGIYSTMTDLMTEISTQMTSQSILARTYVASFDSITQKISVTCTHPHNEDFEISFYPASNNKSYQILGANASTTYASIVATDPNHRVITFPNAADILGGKLFYYVNSNTLGSMFDILLPGNGIFPTVSSNLGIQIAKIPFSPNSNDITVWQDPVPDHWFNVQDFKISGGIDFFISSNTDPSVPLNFNGKSFSIKLGLLKKKDGSISKLDRNTIQQQQQQKGKYILDSSREGYFNDDPSGYRDPWDFANDVLERQYIPSQQQTTGRSVKRRRRF